MTISADRLQDFFGRYAANLTSFDAEASARLWTEPGVIVDDRASMVAESRESMVEGLTMSYPLYKKLGLVSVRHEVLDSTDVSEKLAIVRVRFVFLDAAGDGLTDTTSYYLLRDGGSGLQATVCIETDAAEKLQALAASRGVELPG
ncbi:hypothetical protein ACIQTT_09470 [Microbacterium sp. NPDC090225]|uniref:hypothetical protein n=1 Tax=Microbacterium sp. NPDC090225 TaxID=3364207 RepID=UPI00382FF781